MLLTCLLLLTSAADAPPPADAPQAEPPAPVQRQLQTDAAAIDAAYNATLDDFSTVGLTRLQLKKLRFKLEDGRPGFAPPIALLSSGLVLAFLGFVSTAVGTIGYLLSPGN